MIRKALTFASALIAVATIIGSAHGQTNESTRLKELFLQVHQPQIEGKSYHISGSAVRQVDFELTLGDGTFYPYKPIVYEGDTSYFGGIFIGRSHYRFTPRIEMERNQVNRFFDGDSVDLACGFARIMCSDSICRAITAMASGQADKAFDDAHDITSDLLDALNEKERYNFTYPTLKNWDGHRSGYLQVDVRPEGQPTLVYLFDPLDREQVNFYRQHKVWGDSYLEWISAYPTGVDSTLFDLNGESCELIDEYHVDVNADIDNGGEYTGTSHHFFTALDPTCRFLAFDLNHLLRVSQITDGSGVPISFVRWDDWNNRKNPLYLFLNERPQPGDSLELTFTCYGALADKDQSVEWTYRESAPTGSNTQEPPKTEYVSLDDYDCRAGNDWLPSTGYLQRATYRMTFASASDRAFIASGTKVSEEKKDGRKVTVWEVSRPEAFVTFNLGNLKEYTQEADSFTVDVYFNQHLHDALAPMLLKVGNKLGKHMEQQVAEDVLNAAKLFELYFGPPEYRRITVSELPSEVSHSGTAYPGFINFGFNTFVNTDLWGGDRLLRSHEVAHQWWGGSGAGNETYRDKWLTEGFSEYSALLYLQAVGGSDEMFKKLKDYREDILQERKFLFKGDATLGSVALGSRLATHDQESDYSTGVYKKGAFILHMLRNMMIDLRTMNEDRFFNMMRDYHSIFAGKKASTLDFRRITEKYMGQDMGWFFDEWVYGNDIPTITFTYQIGADSGNTYKAVCTVQAGGVDDNFYMPVPLEIEFPEGRKAYIRVDVDSSRNEFTLPLLSQKPKKLRLNPFESVLATVKQ